MKKLVFFLFVISFFSCADKEESLVAVLEIENPSVVLSEFKNNTVVIIQTNVANWNAKVEEADADWCTVNPQSLDGANFLHVSVTENNNFDERTTTITVHAGKLQKVINLTQIGKKPTIATEKDYYRIFHPGGVLSIKVIANVAFETIVSEPWLHVLEESESGDVQLHVDANLEDTERRAEVLFQEKNGPLMRKVTVIQEKRGEDYEPIEDSGFVEDIAIAVYSAQASESQSGEGIERSYDGDMATLYHSSWTNTKFPVTMTYSFVNVDRMDYLVYYPRTSGNNGNIMECEILATTEANPEYQSIGKYNFAGVGRPSTVIFPEYLEKPKSIRFIVSSGYMNFVSCAEMKFFRLDPNNTIDKTIFADNILSRLQPNVTEEMIQNMSNPFTKNIAYYMFKNQYPKEFRVQSYYPFPNPDTKASQHKTNQYSQLDNPTGIVAEAGKELIVFVGDTYGQNISLRIIDFAGKSYGGTNYALKTGINRLNITGSGLIYVMYHTDNELAQPIDIHIPSGVVNGYFNVQKHKASDWKNYINDAKDAHFDVVGKYAHLVFPTNDFKRYTENGARLMEVWDSIVWLEQRHAGLLKYGREIKNRMFCHVLNDPSDPYMYATSYRTAYQASTMPELCAPQRLRAGSIWGPAHEVGHMNQTRPGFRWANMGEVSNNVFSLYVQTTFGNRSRLLDTSGGNTVYEAATTEIISQRTTHVSCSDPFRKLVPFWQLELYFVKVLGYTDFYPDLYEKIRLTADATSDGAQQVRFAEYCCEIANTDLSEFFEAWGMLTPTTVTITVTQTQVDNMKNFASKYPAPEHKVQYINDNNIEMYRTNAKIEKGTFSATGSTVNLTNWKNVVAIEQYDANDNLVDVSAKTSYVPHEKAVKRYAVGATGEMVLLDY